MSVFLERLCTLTFLKALACTHVRFVTSCLCYSFMKKIFAALVSKEGCLVSARFLEEG